MQYLNINFSLQSVSIGIQYVKFLATTVFSKLFITLPDTKGSVFEPLDSCAIGRTSY